MMKKVPGKRIKLVVASAFIIFLIFYFGNNNLLDVDSIQEFVDGYGAYSVVIFLAISSLRTILFIPTPLIYIAGGLIFGTVLGVLYTTIGVIISTTVLYVLARRFKSFFGRLTRKKINDKINNLEKNKILGTIILMRAIPGIPYDLLSISAGIVDINIWSLLIGTVVGIMPKAIILGSLGSNIDNMLSLKNIVVYILILAVVLMSVYILPKKHFKKVYNKL